jgi:hypothetical protein
MQLAQDHVNGMAVQLKRMGWVRKVLWIKETRMKMEYLLGNLKGWGCLGLKNLGVNVKIILKWILED